MTSVSDGVTEYIHSTVLIQMRPVTVAWQSSDLVNFTPRSAPVLTTTSTTSVSIASTSPTQGRVTASPSSAASNGKGSLSVGAKAGVGTGVTLGALLIAASLIWFVLGRKRRERMAEQTFPSRGHDNLEEVSHHLIDISPASMEKSDGQDDFAQSGLKKLASEMSSENVRAELPGEWQGLEASLSKI